MTLGYIILLILLCLDPPRPNFTTSLQYRTCFSLLLWFSLCVFIQVSYENGVIPDNLSLIYLSMGGICIFGMLYFSENSFLWRFVNISVGSTVREDIFSKYIYSMAVLIERSSNHECLAYLHAAVKSYYQEVLKSDSGMGNEFLKPLLDDILVTPTHGR